MTAKCPNCERNIKFLYEIRVGKMAVQLTLNPDNSLGKQEMFFTPDPKEPSIYKCPECKKSVAHSDTEAHKILMSATLPDCPVCGQKTRLTNKGVQCPDCFTMVG